MAKKISLERIGELMKAVLLELRNAGGEAKGKDLINAVSIRRWGQIVTLYILRMRI
jgi:hypothetical protein